MRTILGTVCVVVCDAAPKLSGHKSYDQARIIELNEQALAFACKVLKQGGNFAIKSFQGTDFPELYALYQGTVLFSENVYYQVDQERKH